MHLSGGSELTFIVLPSPFTECISSALSLQLSSSSSSCSLASLFGGNYDGSPAPSSIAHTLPPVFASNFCHSPFTFIIFMLSLTTHPLPFPCNSFCCQGCIPATLSEWNGCLCCIPPQKVGHRSLRRHPVSRDCRNLGRRSARTLHPLSPFVVIIRPDCNFLQLVTAIATTVAICYSTLCGRSESSDPRDYC
jgi:hypothetical protein